MNAENFIHFIEQPAQLYQITYQELKGLVLQYPYCQNLRLLLATKSWLEQNKDYERHLKMAAMYHSDRKLLLERFNRQTQPQATSENYVITADYLEVGELKGNRSDDQTSLTPFQQSILFEDFETSNLTHMEHHDPDKNKDDQIPENLDPAKERILFIEDLIAEESPLSNSNTPADTPASSIHHEQDHQQKSKEHQELEDLYDEDDIPLEIMNEDEINITPQPVPKSSFSSWLKKYPSPEHSIQYKVENPKQKAEGYVEKKTSKIGDEVISTSKPAEQKKKLKHKKKEKQKDKAPPTPSHPSKSQRPDEEVVSETLAAILAKQGNHEKAIEMYEKLCLIFPEKSTFFAEQIQKLKKI